MRLDKTMVQEMAEGIRQLCAIGHTPEEVRSIMLNSLAASGLNEELKLVRRYQAHLEAAIKQYRRMAQKTETCEICGETVPACLPCSGCGRGGV